MKKALLSFLSRLGVLTNNHELSTNEKLIQSLKSYGDPLTKPRKVDHWVYFNNESDKEFFIKAIEDDRFIIENESFDKDLNMPYILHISRNDSVDLENANKFTSLLESKAKNSGGEYDGWETSIESQ
jgi:hypothetical protein